MLKKFVTLSILLNLLNYVRAPETFNSLYAEDARVFVSERIELGIFQSIFEQHSGYMNLFPRIIFALASVVDLEITPLFVSLLINCTTAWLVTLVYQSWFSFYSNRKIILASASGIALLPLLGISSLGNASYFHFQLLASALLLLASPNPNLNSRSKAMVYGMSVLSDPFFFLILAMASLRIYRAGFKSSLTKLQFVILGLTSLIQGLYLLLISRANRPTSTKDFIFTETLYLYFDRVFGSNLIPFFGFIDNSSKDDTQKLLLRFSASLSILIAIMLLAKFKSSSRNDESIYSCFIVSSLYFALGAFLIAPEVRYAIVPGMVLWFLVGYIIDGHAIKRNSVRIGFNFWFIAMIITSMTPSSVFLEQVRWKEDIKVARQYCKQNKLGSIEIYARPVQVPKGEKRHGFNLSCENLKDN